MTSYGGDAASVATNRMPGSRAGISLASASGNLTDSTGQYVPFGPYNFHVWGTHGSGTTKLQVSPDNGTTWYDVDGTSLTANGAWGPIYLDADSKVRAYISGGTGNSVSAKLAAVG